MGNRYIEEFFSLKCAPDILETVGVVKQMEKELTEAMGIVRRIRKIVLRDKREYLLLDLCAGNALVSVISVHLFPNVRAIAIDNKPRERNWNHAERFHYNVKDIYESCAGIVASVPIVIVACHACKNLSFRVIEIYRQLGQHLILLPCCPGQLGSVPNLLRTKLSRYELWAYTLYLEAKKHSTTCDLVKDQRIQSPRNTVITASSC